MKTYFGNITCLSTCLMTLAALPVGAAAVESQALSAVPHTFHSGDKIRASDMNENFQALEESINIVAETPAPAVELSVRNPGVFAGEVGFGQGANFSLLPGANGATGTAAADAACAATYPGSTAELDLLVLWNAANNQTLPPPTQASGYWTSTATIVPMSGSMITVARTSDCAGWTSDGSTRTGYLRNSNYSDEVSVQLSNQSCAATFMAVACFIKE